jgi:hypothetical protein
MNRFLWVLRHEILVHLRFIGALSFGVTGFMMMLGLLPWARAVTPINLWQTFTPVVPLAGFGLTAGMFSELRSPGRRIDLLMRPASSLEKIGAKLIVATLIFWLAMTVAHIIFSLIGAVLYLIIQGSFPLALFFANGGWLLVVLETFLDYLPIQALFFFGAVYFRRHSLGGTLVLVVSWGFSYMVLGVLAFRLIFAPYLPGANGFGRRSIMGRDPMNGGILDIPESVASEVLPAIVQNPQLLVVIVQVFTILVFWGLAYLRFRETEG